MSRRIFMHGLHVCAFYQVNASIPRHVVPPSHLETHHLLNVFDDNGDGKMDADEFADFAVFLFFRVGALREYGPLCM